MEINYFDLSGGINQASTKTELGTNTKKLYWSDSENVEIFENKGITKQKGNTLFLTLPVEEAITGMCQMEADNVYKLVITTESGKIYIYSDSDDSVTLINKTLSGKEVKFAPFLRGMLVASESDKMFYIKNNESYTIEDCNLNDLGGSALYPDCIAVHKGRVWCAKAGTVYYSALGTYNDFSSPNDAGYINEFHTDTADITGLHNYKDYLAIYKRERVYLLTGNSPEDFAVLPFADRGVLSNNAILNVDNKQYFLSDGIFALEQVGELNQIRLGSEISKNIQNEFKKFATEEMHKTLAVHYQDKHQMWFLFPYPDNDYYQTIWINDYVNYAWYKRVVPQNVTYLCNFKHYILSSDNVGKIYIEDKGSTFDGSAIEFIWKSPFLSLNSPHHKKIIDEFYFILDDERDNKFNFSVYKDYDGNFSGDIEQIYTRYYDQLIWADEESEENVTNSWATDEGLIPVWSIGTNVIEKAEICESLYSVQLCVEGIEPDNNCGIIGLQFREIYNDD